MESESCVGYSYMNNGYSYMNNHLKSRSVGFSYMRNHVTIYYFELMNIGIHIFQNRVYQI